MATVCDVNVLLFVCAFVYRLKHILLLVVGAYCNDHSGCTVLQDTVWFKAHVAINIVARHRARPGLGGVNHIGMY